VQLQAGDVALLYTDGVSEAQAGAELFGIDRLRELLDRHAHERASRIVQALLTGVRAFSGAPLDDLTVLVLKQLADPVPAVRGGAEISLNSAGSPADLQR